MVDLNFTTMLVETGCLIIFDMKAYLDVQKLICLYM